MSKLNQVRKALQDNQNIVILGAPEHNYLPTRAGYWSHTVDFFIAPKSGIYTAKELQSFITSLTPGLEPTTIDNFYESEQELRFGVLYFDEDIGTESIRREVVLTDQDMFASSGFVSGKRIIEHVEKVQRRTWVRLFPNANVAATVLRGD